MEGSPGAHTAHRMGVVAAHASFFALKQLLEVFDKADGDHDDRTSHTKEEEWHDYVCHETNDKIHRASIVLPIRVEAVIRPREAAMVDS